MGHRRVRIIWSDLNGISHGRYVPERRFGGHTHHAVTTLTMGIDGEIIPVEGYGPDVGFADLTVETDVMSRRTGWEADTDVAVANLSFADRPLALCPRSTLATAAARWRALGYEPQLGFEMEFYVMQPDDDAPGGWVTLRNPMHRVYGTGKGGDPTGILLALFDTAEDAGLDVEGVTGEFSSGQMELNMHYCPALEAADRAFVFKEMSFEVAADRGYLLTYIGRPSATLVGSGLHVNFSLSRISDGSNAFDDPTAEHGFSALMSSCIGGLVAHHEAAAALLAPITNSYKRLQPGLLAGYWANWGLDNRISTYRVPCERGVATRIESRMPCGSANPYLAAAVTLNAARLGLEAGLTCGDPQMGDGDSEPNTDRHTPHTLSVALDALEADTDLAASMGPDLVRAYLALKRYDVARRDASGDAWDPSTVTDWELREYLPYF
jgi:glutamine synthetase